MKVDSITIRYTDDLGRIEIPRDIRNQFGTISGDPFKIFPIEINGEKGIALVPAEDHKEKMKCRDTVVEMLSSIGEKELATKVLSALFSL